MDVVSIIMRSFTLEYLTKLFVHTFTTTAPYFISLTAVCCSQPEYWTPPQRLTTEIPRVVPDNERMAIHSADHQQLRKTTSWKHASSSMFSFSELARRNSGDKGICWSHHSDGAGTTLQYQELLVHTCHPQLPFLQECIFTRSVPPDILDATRWGHTDYNET